MLFMLRFSVCVVCETLINKEWLVNPQPFFKVNNFIINATNVCFFSSNDSVTSYVFKIPLAKITSGFHSGQPCGSPGNVW